MPEDPLIPALLSRRTLHPPRTAVRKVRPAPTLQPCLNTSRAGLPQDSANEASMNSGGCGESLRQFCGYDATVWEHNDVLALSEVDRDKGSWLVCPGNLWSFTTACLGWLEGGQSDWPVLLSRGVS